jgi:aryl-alcohol dehydrogenase-like predicted oxidoreductase
MNSPSRRNFLVGSLALASAEAGQAAIQLENQPKAVSASTTAPAKATYTTLGRTGLRVSRLVYGSAEGNDPSLFARALEMGITFFDTSRDYQNGNNEALVGAGLKGKRDQVVLSTKTLDLGIRGAPPVPKDSPQELLNELETSLKELKTDHVDIWYLHHRDSLDQISEPMLEAQRIARKQGKIRFAGISTHRIVALADMLAASKDIDVVMATYSFLSPPEFGEAIAKVKKAGLGVVAFKTTAGGRRGSNPAMKKDGGMLAAYRFALKNPNVDAVESNIITLEELEENVNCMQPFTEEDRKLLAARLERVAPIQCRMCGHCEGACQKGLPTEDILRYLMYAEGYGSFGFGRERYLRIPAELRQVNCGDCTHCTVRCRFGIDVAQQVRRARDLYV